MSLLEANGVLFSFNPIIENNLPHYAVKFASNYSGAFRIKGRASIKYVNQFGPLSDIVYWDFECDKPDGIKLIPKNIDRSLRSMKIKVSIQCGVDFINGKGTQISENRGISVKRPGLTFFDMMTIPLLFFGIALIDRDTKFEIVYPDCEWDSHEDPNL